MLVKFVVLSIIKKTEKGKKMSKRKTKVYIR
ncbi:uncharacterized protein METZ01_LOCUS177948 [marine metagenome]|uniref:Uncharacterized protein n=1 Tax=marine metagenome TaxID=408172 RepID=A0A382CGU2_9ZZZZ